VAEINLPGAAVSAGIGAVVAFLGAAGKNYLDSRREVDISLRSQREPTYKDLWQMTRRFQTWPPSPVSYADGENFQSQLTDWYYGGGGLYLSRASQRQYQGLQEALAEVIATTPVGKRATAMEDPQRRVIRDRCSSLRTALTDDLLTRRSPHRAIRFALPHWHRKE